MSPFLITMARSGSQTSSQTLSINSDNLSSSEEGGVREGGEEGSGEGKLCRT